jgi:adhesin/invasin
VVPNGNTGLPTVIVVQARDQFGNLLTAGGDIVTVDVSGTNPAGSLTVTDNGDGTYSASYTPGSIGTDTVDITINGIALAASPYASTVN